MKTPITPTRTFSVFSMYAAFSLVLIFAVASCDDSSTGTSAGKGTLEVLMHDNPGNYQELWIDVQRVEVNNQMDEGTGWIVISEPQEQFNLLELVNGAQVLLGEAELDEGTYRQIRLILGDNNTLVVDDETYPLKTPSQQQTGLKLYVDAEIREGMTYSLHLDFDVARSVVKRGRGQHENPYLLKPVIRAYSQSETGIISGTVTPAESDPWVYAIAGEDTVSITRSEENTGEFRLLGLLAGTYTVTIEPVAQDFEATEISDVEVTAGEVKELGTIEL
ncbi:DUF4382 domain-containing protein [Balneolales bacterium ANBcel1]|nr:DUF4382 domain-containing protein [Balneolales bacterium ANBcel1]